MLVFANSQGKDARAVRTAARRSGPAAQGRAGHRPRRSQSWEFEFSLEHQSPVLTVSWRTTGDVLLTGGEVLTLWQADSFADSQTVKGWTRLWETRCAAARPAEGAP